MKLEAFFKFIAKDPITAAIVGGILLIIVGTLLENEKMTSFAGILLLVGFAMFVIKHNR